MSITHRCRYFYIISLSYYICVKLEFGSSKITLYICREKILNEMRDFLYVMMLILGIALGVSMSITYTNAKVRECNSEIVAKIDSLRNDICSINERLDTLGSSGSYNIKVLENSIGSLKSKVSFIEAEIREINKDIDSFD